MKNKYLIILFLIANVLLVFGAIMKIIHYQLEFFSGNTLLTLGMILEGLVITIFIIKTIATRNVNFLNK